MLTIKSEGEVLQGGSVTGRSIEIELAALMQPLRSRLLLLLFASTKFCDLGIPTILRVLIFAISRSRAKFCVFAQPKVKAQL